MTPEFYWLKYYDVFEIEFVVFFTFAICSQRVYRKTKSFSLIADGWMCNYDYTYYCKVWINFLRAMKLDYKELMFNLFNTLSVSETRVNEDMLDTGTYGYYWLDKIFRDYIEGMIKNKNNQISVKNTQYK